MTRPAICICYLVLLMHSRAIAQEHFHAVLINWLDSTRVPNAAVSIAEIEKTLITDTGGRFHCKLPASQKELTLTIAAIGCKATINYRRTFEPLEKVYVEILPSSLSNFTIVGLSAEDVVRKAVACIPQNYADSSYFCPSSYRQYQRINGKFRNLIEARPVILFNLTKQKGSLVSKEAYAVKHLRRTDFVYEPGHPYSDNISRFITENPVYHLEASSLNPVRFSKYIFTFDTTAKNDTFYFIRYFINDFSMETHGVENLGREFWGESYEKGTIKIERGSFAIAGLKRNTYRYRSYTYPKRGGNNWVMPEKRYYVEFKDASLNVEYARHDGKWNLDKLAHQYTNEFYRGGWGTLEYVVTCNFEWQADSVTRYTTDEYRDRFFTQMQVWHLPYDSTYWATNNFPFYLNNKDYIYRSMGGKEGPYPHFIPNVEKGE